MNIRKTMPKSIENRVGTEEQTVRELKKKIWKLGRPTPAFNINAEKETAFTLPIKSYN